LKALIESLLSALELFNTIEVLSCRLNSKSSVSDINTMFSESFLKFSVEKFTNFWLRGRFLINPEADLVREFFIIETSWQKSLFNDIKLYFLGPFVRLEIAVDLFSGNILRKPRVDWG